MGVAPGLKRVFGRGNCIHPRSRFVRLTSRCNQRCAFCNIRGGESFELTAAEAGALVDAARADAAAVVHLTGGEPTLRRDLFELAARAAAGGRSVFVQTNGIRLAQPGYAAALRAAGVSDVIVSYHAATAARADALTAAPGTFELTRRGLGAAAAAGLGLWPNLVFTAGNLDEGPAVVRALGRDAPGLAGLILSVVQPHGLALAAGAEVVPRLRATATAVRRTITAATAAGMPYHLSYCENPLCFVLRATGERAPIAAVRAYVRRRLGLNGCHDCRLVGEMGKDKVKPAACAGCELADVCFGVWRAQLAIHGEGEVEPRCAPGAGRAR
ncbi:MAG TPA: radical SAM protein [Polyangia bacterium]